MSGPRLHRNVPIITLTTDFGLRDPYVAEMKAVILSLTRDVQLIDVTHDIAPQDVMEARLVLERVAPRFPPGTIHLAVVDPGVGTARRGIVVQSGGHCFVGPDNGIFTAVLSGREWRVFELRDRRFRRSTISATFHGRDVFAPAAAHLALGVPPERFGPRVTEPVRLMPSRVRREGSRVTGHVVLVDRFGNLVTSVRTQDLPRPTARLEVEIAGVVLPMVSTYGALEPGGIGALLGSHDRVEVAVRDGSAARTLGVGRGTAVVVRKRQTRVRTTSSRSSRARTLPETT